MDSGKTHHHCVAIDQAGAKLLSRRVPNGEPELLQFIQDVLAMGDHVTWAVDMAGGEPGLLLALLTSHDQELLYMPGRVVNRASDGYRGEGKTDARDALVIADQARIRRDFKPMRPTDEATIELKVLTGRRTDLVRDRTRAINRLRGALTGMFPALDRALVFTNAGPLLLLEGYQTPAGIRRMGTARLTRWLRGRGVRSPQEPAATAVGAAEQQHTTVPGTLQGCG
ncbi:IS110 family transposase [Couchioplanes caeruleus]|uniref:IS110 family transposase n=1 Tax=Couchioplanes caeruleus TaxID=56438 RepID=UPI0008FF2218|nr:transposase [Couchioplanes caeruleus]